MEIVYSIVLLVSSVSLFLYAMSLASKGMETIASTKLKGVLNKTSSSPLVGVGIGCGVTAVIQSSAATTVMLVGLVNAGILGLVQATYMIMGANIGTTVTAQIASLQAFDVSALLMLFAPIGFIFRLAAKKGKTKALGDVLFGLGMIFIALDLMSGAIKDMNNTAFFTSFLPSIENPFLLLLTGILVTVMLQSSSALTGVLIALSIAGVVIGKGGNSMYYIILGSNIGTCSTALMSTFGANSNGKRAALIHLMFNVIGSVIFFIFLLIYKDFATDVMERLFAKSSTQIAMFHTLFNVVSTIILLPFAKYLVKIANKLVKEKENKYQFKYIDERFLNTPFMAVSMLNKEIAELLLKVEEAFKLSIGDYLKQEENNREAVTAIRNEVALANQSLTEYLISVSSSEVDYTNEARLSSYHHVLADIDRIADLCMSVIRVNERGIRSNISYSSASFEEISAMKEDLLLLLNKVHSAFLKRDKSLINEIERIEDGIDIKREQYSSNHITRLNKKECPTESSSLYTSLLNSLERMGDHLTFIARSLVEVAHKN